MKETETQRKRNANKLPTRFKRKKQNAKVELDYRILDINWRKLGIQELMKTGRRELAIALQHFPSIDWLNEHYSECLKFNQETKQMDCLFDRLFRETMIMKLNRGTVSRVLMPDIDGEEDCYLLKPSGIAFNEIRHICRNWHLSSYYDKSKCSKLIRGVFYRTGLQKTNIEHVDIFGIIWSFLSIKETEQVQMAKQWFELFDEENDEMFCELFCGWRAHLRKYDETSSEDECEFMASKLSTYAHIFDRYDAFELFFEKFDIPRNNSKFGDSYESLFSFFWEEIDMI